MRILVIGSGGREHALAWKLGRSSRVSEVISCPGNGGLAKAGQRWANLSPTIDEAALLARIVREKIDLVAIGPEGPLVAGLGDRLRDLKIPTFGPGAPASRLEGSKIYSKSFMTRHGVPTARHVVVDAHSDLEAEMEQFKGGIVVKADGLAAGKGVVVTDDAHGAVIAARSMIFDGAFGDAGRQVVLEERLDGIEMTMLVFVSGRQYLILESAQDYKPLQDSNRGPNTGGMGSYSPTHLFGDEVRRRAVDEILEPTLAGLEADGIEYRGVLYLGLMLTSEGPQLLEYNARFGDPETQPLVMRLETDLVDIFEAIELGTLDRQTLSWRPESALCLVLASNGYPVTQEYGKLITGECFTDPDSDVQVFHAGTDLLEDSLVTAGGRVLGVTALGQNLAEARGRAYEKAERINYAGKTHRSDIGIYGTPYS